MNYKLVREKRKTVSITVKDGEVTVKAPRTTSEEDIDRFVTSKERWIAKKLSDYSVRTTALSGVIDGTQALVYGELCNIEVSDKYKRVQLESGTLFVPSKYASKADGIKKAVSAWYRRTAAKVLEHTLAAASIRTGLRYESFALTNAKGKWGSCDGKCNIRLNWRLIMLNDNLTDYVIVHELCHTLHHDHSAAFWAEVKKRYGGDVAAAKKQLKFFSVLTSLYR